MKKYTIRRHGNRFKIHEKSTGAYVASSTKQHRAKTVAHNLENGGGFDDVGLGALAGHLRAAGMRLEVCDCACPFVLLLILRDAS